MSAKAQQALEDTAAARWFLGALTLIKATGDTTVGEFSLWEQTAPANCEIPYHVHELEDQAFYVLDGEMCFIIDGKWRRLGPGGYVYLPRSLPHGFCVTGSTPARYLVLNSPAGFEGFVMDMSDPASYLGLPKDVKFDLAKLVELGRKYKIKLVGPLPQRPPGMGDVLATDRGLIDATRGAYLTAAKNRDADAIAGLFTEDAIQMPPHAPANTGRDEIRAWAQRFFRAPKVDIRLTVHDLEVSRDRAIENGAFRATLVPEGFQDEVQNSGKYLRLYQRLSDGGWAVSHDIWNSDHPL